MQQRYVQDSCISSQKKTGIKRKLDTGRQDVEGQRQMDSLRRRMKVSAKFSSYIMTSGVGVKRMSLSQREREMSPTFIS